VAVCDSVDSVSNVRSWILVDVAGVGVARVDTSAGENAAKTITTFSRQVLAHYTTKPHKAVHLLELFQSDILSALPLQTIMAIVSEMVALLRHECDKKFATHTYLCLRLLFTNPQSPLSAEFCSSFISVCRRASCAVDATKIADIDQEDNTRRSDCALGLIGRTTDTDGCADRGSICWNDLRVHYALPTVYCDTRTHTRVCCTDFLIMPRVAWM
jgi:hypothetical protein